MRAARIQSLSIRAKVDDARRLRRQILDAICDLVDADAAAVFHVRKVGDTLYFGAGDVVGDGDGATSLDPWPAEPISSKLEARICCPDPCERTCFRALSDSDNGSSKRPFDPELFSRLSTDPRTPVDGLDLLLFNESCFAGWIGLWRYEPSKPFGPEDREKLNGKIARFRSQVLESLDLETRTHEEQSGTLLLRPDGKITHMSPAVEVWFGEEHHEQLLDYLDQIGATRFQGAHFLFGMHARVAPLNGIGFEPVYMIGLQPAELPCISLQSVLTPTQQEVARLAVDGKSSEEIAEILTRSPHTIKTHLRDIYRRLDISSRFELAAHFHQH